MSFEQKQLALIEISINRGCRLFLNHKEVVNISKDYAINMSNMYRWMQMIMKTNKLHNKTEIEQAVHFLPRPNYYFNVGKKLNS